VQENQRRASNFLWAGGSFLACSKENQQCPGGDIIHDGPLLAVEIEAAGHDASSVIRFVNAVQVAMGCARVVGPAYASYQDPAPGDLEPGQLWPAAKVAVQRLTMLGSKRSSPSINGDDMRSAVWFDKVTGGGLNADQLRRAAGDGRLERSEKAGTGGPKCRWRHNAVEVAKVYPEFADKIRRKLADEAGRSATEPDA